MVLERLTWGRILLGVVSVVVLAPLELLQVGRLVPSPKENLQGLARANQN